MNIREIIDCLRDNPRQNRRLDAEIHVKLFKPAVHAEDLRYYRVPHESMDYMELCQPGTYWLKERSGASLHTAPYYTGAMDHERIILLLKAVEDL